MKYLFILVAVVSTSIFTRPWPTGRGGTETVESYARRLQPRVGVRVGDGRVTAIRADGDTLVVIVDGPANWRAGMPSFQLTRPFLTGFCNSGRAKPFFHDGRAIRLDTTEAGGGLIRGEPSTRCPDA